MLPTAMRTATDNAETSVATIYARGVHCKANKLDTKTLRLPSIPTAYRNATFEKTQCRNVLSMIFRLGLQPRNSKKLKSRQPSLLLQQSRTSFLRNLLRFRLISRRQLVTKKLSPRSQLHHRRRKPRQLTRSRRTNNQRITMTTKN